MHDIYNFNSMRNFTKTIAIIAIIGLSFNYSCKKDSETVVDCLADIAYIHLNHSIDPNNANKAILEVTYSGEYALDNTIHWDFGDGKTQSLEGAKVEHTYSASGKYTVKADVITRDGDAYCGHELHETVDIK